MQKLLFLFLFATLIANIRSDHLLNAMTTAFTAVGQELRTALCNRIAIPRQILHCCHVQCVVRVHPDYINPDKPGIPLNSMRGNDRVYFNVCVDACVGTAHGRVYA